MSPDVSKFLVCQSALDAEEFKPKLIEELEETNIRMDLKLERDLVAYDTCKSSYGYALASETQSLTALTDKDGNEIHFLGSPNSMQGVLNMRVVPLINVTVPERKARLAPDVFDRLFDLEQLPEGPEKQHEMENFLLGYGSHFHIGGSVQVGAVFECVIKNQQCDEEDHEDMWSTIYDASKKNYQASNEQKVWVKAEKIVNDEDMSKERLSEYKVRIHSIGNLPELRDVDKWKREILQSADHLPVVRRINSNVVGIWDLIKKEEEGFHDSESLAEQMKAVWEKIVEESSPKDMDKEEDMIPESDDEFHDSSEISENQDNTQEHTTDENHRQMELHKLLEMLNLQQYYPGKLLRQEVLKLKQQNTQERQPTDESEDMMSEDSVEEQYGGPLAMEDVVMSVINKLIGIDYRCRNKEIWRCSLSAKSRSNKPEDCFSANTVMLPHPQDVLLLAYQCCEPALQQLLASKMSICRLAIPFVIPTEEDKLEIALWPLRNITIEWTGDSEKSFTKHPMHVVSFLRIGNAHSSKSETINNILSSDTNATSHDTFYRWTTLESGIRNAFRGQ